MTAGESRSVAVVVTGASPNTCATKTYTLNLRVLNIYEVYYGYYAPVGLLNKQYSWVNPVQSPETPPLSGEYTNTHTAYLNQSSGTMVWGVKWVTVLVQAQSQMRFTAYNNFGDALNETLSRHDGDERWPTTLPYALDYIEDLATKGYVVTGNMTALTNTSGNGTQTGTVPMNSTYGNTIISMALNLTIQNRDAVVGDNSYTNVTYMGVTKRLKYLATTAAKKSLASAYWNPSVPWVKTDFMDASWVE
jgi:hypothetical protein